MARDVFWVLQGSIIGPLLFNTYLVDLLVIMDDIDIAIMHTTITICYCRRYRWNYSFFRECFKHLV